MAKVKYYYDSETLSYRKIEPKKGRFILYLMLILFGGFLFFTISLLIYFGIPNLQFPKEKVYKRELDQLKFQYEIMNRELDEAQTVLAEMEERDNNIYRIYFEADPISAEQRKSGFGGVNRYKYLEGYDNSEILKKTKERIDKLKKRIVVHSKSLDEIVEFARNKEAFLAALPAIQPIQNDDLKRTASGYGMRMHPIYKIRKFHRGMDFSAPVGTPIFATGDAVVKKVRRSRRGYGYHIVLDHNFNYQTLYAHLSKIGVYQGQKIKRGEIIGYVGNTGTSTAPHLHYEVLKNGRPMNPIYFYFNDLSVEDYETMLNNSALENQSFD